MVRAIKGVWSWWEILNSNKGVREGLKDLLTAEQRENLPPGKGNNSVKNIYGRIETTI